jgi:hypothetical protein
VWGFCSEIGDNRFPLNIFVAKSQNTEISRQMLYTLGPYLFVCSVRPDILAI